VNPSQDSPDKRRRAHLVACPLEQLEHHSRQWREQQAACPAVGDLGAEGAPRTAERALVPAMPRRQPVALVTSNIRVRVKMMGLLTIRTD
jgi:hypothetical protein